MLGPNIVWKPFTQEELASFKISSSRVNDKYIMNRFNRKPNGKKQHKLPERARTRALFSGHYTPQTWRFHGETEWNYHNSGMKPDHYRQGDNKNAYQAHCQPLRLLN